MTDYENNHSPNRRTPTNHTPGVSALLMDAHVRTYKIRKAFPKVAEAVDLFRPLGATKPAWAEEKGRTIGKKLEGRAYTWK